MKVVWVFLFFLIFLAFVFLFVVFFLVFFVVFFVAFLRIFFSYDLITFFTFSSTTWTYTFFLISFIASNRFLSISHNWFFVNNFYLFPDRSSDFT